MRRFDKELDNIRSNYFYGNFGHPNYIMMFDDGSLCDMLNETEITYEDFLKIKTKYNELVELSIKQVLIDEIMEKVDNVLKDIKHEYYKRYIQNRDKDTLKATKRCVLITLWTHIWKEQKRYESKIQKEHERIIRKAEKQNEKSN